MTLGEVCLLTDDVVRLADFYKMLLGVDNGSEDTVIRPFFPGKPCLRFTMTGKAGRMAYRR